MEKCRGRPEKILFTIWRTSYGSGKFLQKRLDMILSIHTYIYVNDIECQKEHYQ